MTSNLLLKYPVEPYRIKERTEQLLIQPTVDCRYFFCMLKMVKASGGPKRDQGGILNNISLI